MTDDQGRRRFHGAFTGGFSAGYFNTVGSKEGKYDRRITEYCFFVFAFASERVLIVPFAPAGWAPSSFVSTRGNRSDRQQFKPEDFMDEEDMAVGCLNINR